MDADMAQVAPNDYNGLSKPSPPVSYASRPEGASFHDHKRSQSASAATDRVSEMHPSAVKTGSLPPILPPSELYSHLRDTTTEVAPHPVMLSPLLRSSSFRKRLSTPLHLTPTESPSRSRPPSPLATKTHSGSSSSGSGGYFDFIPGGGMDTPMLDHEFQGQGLRRGSVNSDAFLLTPAEERQFSMSSWITNNGSSTLSSSPRTLSQRGSQDQLNKAAMPPSPESGSKLSGGDSPSRGTLERRARRREVVRLDSFGGEGLVRKPSARRLAGFPGSDLAPLTAGVEVSSSETQSTE